MITINDIKRHFSYNRKNGKLYWKDHFCRSKSRFIGKEAGSLKSSHNKNYLRVKFLGEHYVG